MAVIPDTENPNGSFVNCRLFFFFYSYVTNEGYEDEHFTLNDESYNCNKLFLAQVLLFVLRNRE